MTSSVFDRIPSPQATVFESLWSEFSYNKFAAMDDQFLMQWQHRYGIGTFEGLMTLQNELRDKLKNETHSPTVVKPALDRVSFLEILRAIDAATGSDPALIEFLLELFDFDTFIENVIAIELDEWTT